MVRMVSNPVKGNNLNPVKDKPQQIALCKFIKTVNSLLFRVPDNNPVKGKGINLVNLAAHKN